MPIHPALTKAHLQNTSNSVTSLNNQEPVKMKTIPDTDLILNSDGSIYHLNLLPEDIASTVITVGDPGRVSAVSKHFDSIEIKKSKREFTTHTGYIGKKRISVMSTGIGTDNIDIVLNELDALVNVDLTTRVAKQQLTSLDIIRIGTSGAIHPDIETGSILISEYALGLDNLMHYYVRNLDGDEHDLQDAAHSYFHHLKGLSPYVASGSQPLIKKFGNGLSKGFTVTAPGFYAPQGREIRSRTTIPDFVELFSGFRLNDLRLTNLEMETAGIYALAKVLGHRAVSINAILGNRTTFKFSKHPDNVIDNAIEKVIINL